MVMEGRGGNTPRRLLPWHAEVRATIGHAVKQTLAVTGDMKNQRRPMMSQDGSNGSSLHVTVSGKVLVVSP